MDREYADNKSNTGNSARISEMEQGELSYFLKLFEYLRDALNNAPTSFMSRGKRMVDVDKVRDIIDDIRLNLPSEIKQAKAIVADRSDIIDNAKKEAEAIVRKAEDRARALVSEQEVVKAAQARASEILSQAQMKSREIRQAAQEYSDGCLMKTEELLVRSLTEVKATRQAFRNATGK